MTRAVENTHLARLLRTLEEQNERVLRIAGGLNGKQLSWNPPEGGWGIGLILEHLIKSAEPYYDVLPRKMAAARSKGLLAKDPAWKRSWFGSFLVKSLEGPRKVKTLKRFIADGVSDRVVERFIETQERISGFIQDADGLDLSRIRVASPFFPLLRYNLADCLAILVVHTTRHLNRAEEVSQMPTFPATTTV